MFLYASDFAMPAGWIGSRRPRLKIVVDGKSIGEIANNQYGCLSISPGTHTLGVGRELMEVEASEARDTFVRIEKAEGHEKLRLRFTETLELGSEALSRANFQDKTVNS